MTVHKYRRYERIFKLAIITIFLWIFVMVEMSKDLKSRSYRLAIPANYSHKQIASFLTVKFKNGTSINGSKGLQHKYVNSTGICSQEKRKEYLHKLCDLHANTKGRRSNEIEIVKKARFIVDDANKVAYCYIQKTGCTTWITIMANISTRGNINSNMRNFQDNIHKGLTYGQVAGKMKHGLRYQGHYSEDLEGYVKFLVTRNPMERLMSGYNDKMQGRDEKYRGVVQSAAKTYRYHHHIKNTTSAYPTFEEFIKILQEGRFSKDPHFRTYFELCSPCQIRYDYILKLETMDEDMRLFIAEVYGEAYFKYLGENLKLNSAKSDRSRTRMVEDVPFSKILPEFKVLSDYDVENVMGKFRNELEYFGYKFNKSEVRSVCEYGPELVGDSVDGNCC